MKRGILFTVMMAALNLSYAQQKIKVACIGNSITAGGYPKLLQALLGEGYEVRNYGIGGRTLLKNGDLPYWKEKKFIDVKEYAADIVVIKLGTNDSKPQNWKYSSEFVADYKAFIKEFKQLKPKPKIWLCYPVPVVKDNFGIRDSIVKGEIIPKIKKIAKATKLPIIDLYQSLQPFKDHFPDGVHPDQVAAGQIAKSVYEAIREYKPKRK